MSETAKVRLVRCPKCENLLPELTNYSVYQCGGCGAVLRANKRVAEAETSSDKSDDGKIGGVSEKISKNPENFNYSEKGMVNFSDGSEHDAKSNGSSSSRAENREVLSDRVEKYRNGSKIKADTWVVENDIETNENFENDIETNENLDDFNHSKMGREVEDLKPPKSNANGFQRSVRTSDRRIRERDEMEGFWRNPRMDYEGVRYSTSKYSQEGPSNYQLGSGYGYGEPVKNRNEMDGNNKVEYLEQDRAELLRKLDELKDQLSRSCDVNDKPKEKIPLDRRMVHQDPYGASEAWFPDGSLGANRASMQYPIPDRHVARRTRHISNYPEPSPFTNTHEMAMHSFYPPMHTSSQVQGMDPVRSQMLRRAPHQPSIPLQQHPSHPYYSGHYMDNDMDPFEPYPHNINLHLPSCSCFHCYNKRPQVPAPIPPPAFYNKMYPDIPNNPMFYHHENPNVFGPRDYNPRTTNPQMHSHNPQSHTRWPSDLNSEVGGFVRRRTPRVVLATGARHCCPIAGGAPFITCNNCFELLQLPKKVLFVEKNQKKIRCGACSTVILFAVVNKKLIVSINAETKRSPTKVDDSTDVAVNGGTSNYHGHVNRPSMNFSSDDYDNSGYDFQSMDREPTSLSTGQGLSSNKTVDMRSLHSTSPCTSEDEASPDSLIATRDRSNSAELPMKAYLSPPLSGSPLQDHFDYSSKYRAVDRIGKGSVSGRSEREKIMPKKVASRQNSVKESSLATEMEVSFNEYSNTGVSQDSGDGSREDQLRVNKGAESFFAGIIKKSFRDFSRSNRTVDISKSNVTINGHPIPDRLVKKAEKLAGSIHPGQYWYDSRAGFWGVMGGPCIGIVPPFIEEFNYPMPENCAGGDTAVFVNGRELHQKDLQLLGSRGLPTARDRSYIIEISGRVLDEASGEELDSLGKLAPTVERVKHGFGMKVPRPAATS
ncbi:protein ENHANCED DISEASE RESISTANCE 4-like [Cornus florida]|uniref:protein ENHANCED DISEASE RESISTANCE 4-like n=1 Tax=Cornus florida TaxID=4283 RepID=UPI00289B3217|nr:protein ENHANCED DISEASE RESISTANCE 4-like [Cornus florida]